MDNPHSPIVQKRLRKPGQTLRRKIRCKMLVVIGVLFGSVILYLGMLLGGLGFAWIPYFGWWVTALWVGFAFWARHWEKRQEIALNKLELGLDGEVFVGEFLNAAGIENEWHVLHDFDIGFGNIDHIVIAPQGVFAIETKTVSRYDGESTILYDGEKVRTEKRKIDSPFPQATREATHLGERIRTKLTMNVFVQPIVTYPGWQLQLVGGKKLDECSVWICFTTGLPKVINKRPVTLSTEEQLRIYHFLASENEE